jgi:hypothetical protein
MASICVLSELGLDGSLGKAVGERVLEPAELLEPGQEVFGRDLRWQTLGFLRAGLENKFKI